MASSTLWRTNSSAKRKPSGIEHAIFAHDERVFERGAERIAGAPQFGHVAHETERACARNLATERIGLNIERKRLAADQRMIELDFGLDPEAVLIGPQFAVGAVLGHRYRS